MRVKYAAIPAVFAEARKVREALREYCLAPDKVPVSLDDISRAIEHLYGIKITTRLVPLNSRLLRGMIEIYDKTATIYIDAELNTPMTRYVQVKEAAHVMIVNAENITKDPGAIIQFFVQAGLLPKDDDGNHPDDILAEELTKFVAIELLFPHELRKAAQERIAANEDTLFTIAEWLHIPEHLVEFALSDTYMTLSNKIYTAE